MDLGSLGVWYASDKLTPQLWRRFVERIESMGYTTLWYSESRGFESMAFGTFLLECSSSLIIGSSIANIYARDAVTSRQGMLTMAATSGGRYILGLGVSHPPLVENLRGHHYGKPVATMRAYLEQMMQGAEDAPGWPLTLAALGPRMLELCGELTRGALPYNVTPEHTARARNILGPDRWLVVEQKVCLESDPDTARELARNELARYLLLDNYRNCWLTLGFDEEDFERGGSNRFLDAMVAWGDADTIEQRIREHYDAGASHVCIQPVHRPGDMDAALGTLQALAPQR